MSTHDTAISTRKAPGADIYRDRELPRTLPDRKTSEIVHAKRCAIPVGKAHREMAVTSLRTRAASNHSWGWYASLGTSVPRTKYFSGSSPQYELPLHFCLSLRAVSGLKILITR